MIIAKQGNGAITDALLAMVIVVVVAIMVLVIFMTIIVVNR